MVDNACPICGADVTGRSPISLAGWRFCSHHKVTVNRAKFDSRCDSCLGQISEGDTLLLCRHGSVWVAIHPRTYCIEKPVDRPGPYAKLFLSDDAPWFVVQAVYKALALTFHPDRGGDEERMKEINDAVDLIRARSRDDG